MAAVTWNPSDKNAGITLSGGNLIATCSSGSGSVNQTLRATQSISSTVKTYFEVTASGTVGQYLSIGVMNGGASLTGNVGATNGICFCNKFGPPSDIYLNGNGQGHLYPALVAGQVLRIAVDRANNKIWFAINNNTWSGAAIWFGSGGTTDDPNTGAGGASLSAVSGTIYPAFGGAYTGDVGTFNGGTAGFAYAVPTGFTALDSVASPITYAQVTQASLEEWTAGNPLAQVTQVTIEQWVATATVSRQALVTQVALEQWALTDLLIPPLTGAQARVMVMA